MIYDDISTWSEKRIMYYAEKMETPKGVTLKLLKAHIADCRDARTAFVLLCFLAKVKKNPSERNLRLLEKAINIVFLNGYIMSSKFAWNIIEWDVVRRWTPRKERQEESIFARFPINEEDKSSFS